MGNLVKWYRIKSKLNINTKNKKVKTIIYNSFDLFYCLKLFLFNKCRGPPTPFNFQILKLNGGIKMDKPTTFEVDGNELFADFNNKKYFIKFKNYENKEITSEIPKEVFFAYIESKKEIKKGTNETERHWEQNEVTDNTLYKRAVHSQKSVEEIVIENERNKIIHNVINGLRKSQKTKLIKYYFEEKTEEEIAKEENMSQQAISKGLELAKENFGHTFRKKFKKF